MLVDLFIRRGTVGSFLRKVTVPALMVISISLASVAMTAAIEPNVEGSVTIAGGPCGAPMMAGGACRSADEAGEGVGLVFAAKAAGGGSERVTAGGGGRFAARLAPGEYELRLASGQGGALRFEGRLVRVPESGKVVVDVRVEALRP